MSNAIEKVNGATTKILRGTEAYLPARKVPFNTFTGSTLINTRQDNCRKQAGDQG